MFPRHKKVANVFFGIMGTIRSTLSIVLILFKIVCKDIKNFLNTTFTVLI